MKNVITLLLICLTISCKKETEIPTSKIEDPKSFYIQAEINHIFHQAYYFPPSAGFWGSNTYLKPLRHVNLTSINGKSSYNLSLSNIPDLYSIKYPYKIKGNESNLRGVAYSNFLTFPDTSDKSEYYINTQDSEKFSVTLTQIHNSVLEGTFEGFISKISSSSSPNSPPIPIKGWFRAKIKLQE